MRLAVKLILWQQSFRFGNIRVLQSIPKHLSEKNITTILIRMVLIRKRKGKMKKSKKIIITIIHTFLSCLHHLIAGCFSCKEIIKRYLNLCRKKVCHIILVSEETSEISFKLAIRAFLYFQGVGLQLFHD